MRIKRALVTGAGIGGLGAAISLVQRGVDVDVVGVKPRIDDVATNLPANALRALRRLGLLKPCTEVGFQYDRNEFFDWHGNLLVECPSMLTTPSAPEVPSYLAMHRNDLHTVLSEAAEAEGANVAFGTELLNLTDQGEEVEVVLSDGRVQHYDLVIAFDGIDSPLRRHLFGARGGPAFTGYSVWRTIVERPSEITNPRFFQGDGTRAAVMPVSERFMCLLQVTPEPGNPQHPPERYTELLAARLQGYRGLIGTLRENLPAPEHIVYTPLSDVPLPPSWYHGRVVMLGTAVHGCAPHAIHGSGLSLEDAVVLADGIEQGLSLPNFMWRRFDRVQLARDSSRAVLFTEIATTAEHAADRLRRTLPGQLHAVETYLNQHY